MNMTNIFGRVVSKARRPACVYHNGHTLSPSQLALSMFLDFVYVKADGASAFTTVDVFAFIVW